MKAKLLTVRDYNFSHKSDTRVSDVLPVKTGIRFTDIPDLEGSWAKLGVKGDPVPTQ